MLVSYKQQRVWVQSFSKGMQVLEKKSQMHAQMTRHEVVDIIDGVDDNLISQIIDTGATKHELFEAITWLSNDEDVLATGLDEDARGRVSQLCEILSASLPDEEDR